MAIIRPPDHATSPAEKRFPTVVFKREYECVAPMVLSIYAITANL